MLAGTFAAVCAADERRDRVFAFNEKIDRRGTACIKWDFQEMDYKGKSGLLPFSIADADYRIHEPILQALKDRIDTGVIGYTDLGPEYFEAVRKWCRERHDWEVEKEWLVPVGGIVPAINTLIEVLTGPDAGIIVQPPVYDPFYSVVEAAGRRCLKNDLILDEDGYHMDFAGLEKLAADGAEMLVLCSPHNPVCRVWTREELQKVADIAARYGLYVVSDEIHWDLVLGGCEHVTMGQFRELYERLVVCTSCSKTFNIAGLETSTLIIPGEAVRTKVQDHLYARYLFVPNTLGLTAVVAAYNTGSEWVDEEQRFLTENAKIVGDFLAEHLPKVKLARPEGTYLLWMDMRAYGLSSDELIDRIAEEGAGLNAGNHYGENYDGFVRMNVACPKEQLLAGLACIERALNNI